MNVEFVDQAALAAEWQGGAGVTLDDLYLTLEARPLDPAGNDILSRIARARRLGSTAGQLFELDLPPGDAERRSSSISPFATSREFISTSARSRGVCSKTRTPSPNSPPAVASGCSSVVEEELA